MKRQTALLLTLEIIILMVFNSADFFFRRPYYEFWDLAANSLSVIRAKHFSELYGSYSRWGFHHPGPVYFYIQAFGEWLFYDLLHLTPAPFNAQTLANLCVMVGFFVAGLTVFSRWLTAPAQRWFIPAALALGAWHFGAVSRMPSFDMLAGSSVFSSAWTAHSWVFPFLCMLAAGASVAAGRGRDLPLLALADGFLIHAHIASPLFVGPMTLLAYTGLLVTTARRERAAVAGGERVSGSGWETVRRMPGAAWRAFPQRHVVAVSILAVFALPMVIDLFLGDASNFHAIIMHLRTHHGEHKTLRRSLFYFVQFGAYRPYKDHAHAFRKFDQAGAYAYLWYHKKIYAAWIVAILLVIWTSAVRPTLVGLGRWREDASAPRPDGAATPPVPVDRTRFLAWAGGFLLLSIPLTLFWGIIQDGEMFYYSGWCNFAIGYFGLLIVLAELSSMLAARMERQMDGAPSQRETLHWVTRLVTTSMFVLACVLNAGRFRVRDPVPEVNRAMHESFRRVVQDARARNPVGIKVFDCQFFAWPAATGLGLEMVRQGQSFMVVNGLSAEHFSIPFGRSHAWRPTPPESTHTMELWRFRIGRDWKMWASAAPKWYVPRGRALEQALAVAEQEKDATGDVAFYPLLDGVELRVGVPFADPKDETELDFRRGSRGPGSALYGFSDPEDWGMWNQGPSGALRLRGAKVDASENVEIILDAHPFLAPAFNVTAQRLNLAVNGTLLGPETRVTEDREVIFNVPGALWNRTFGQSAGAALEFGFPDSAAPAAIDPAGSNDGRPLGVGLRALRFRTVPSERSQPALELAGSGSPAALDFKPGGNASDFQADGWYEPEAWGTWSQGHVSKLHFHSRLIEGTREMEISLRIHSVMESGSGITGQRVRVSLGGIPVDRERTVETGGTLVLRISATVWNTAVANDGDAVLVFQWPDAISPARLDPAGQEKDGRLLAVGVERIDFRDVPAPVMTAR